MRFPSLVMLAFVSLTAGCATQTPTSSTDGTTLVQTGQIIDVRDIATTGGQTTGIGAVVGSVLGAIAGSNIGGGYGSTAAAIGGGVAGGYAGHQVEASGTSQKSTAVTVRLDDGGQRVYNTDATEAFRVGDTVKVITNSGVTRVTH